MIAQRIVILDMLRPSIGCTMEPVRRRRRVRALAPRTTSPHIALLNGRPLMRAEWRRRVVDGDHVVFVVLPQGGGDGESDPMRMIGMLAISWFAPWAAGQLGAGFLVQSAISIAGNVLLNALLPPPKPPSSQAAAAAAAPSPTYNLQAQGNQARLDAPIPVLYGRHVIYPDFAAQPYAEYSGNEQYLYQLFVISQGEVAVEAIRIEDTDISSFEEADTEIVAPGASPTLFPTAVVTAAEVAGQEMTYNVALGPYIVNAAGTDINAIAIDIVFPRGLFYATAEGALTAVTVTWTVETREVDDSGTAIGSWQTVGTESYSAATVTPQRLTYRYGTSVGRHEVRVKRTNVKATDSTTGDEIAWASLRGYLPGTPDYGDVTLLAVRIRASNQLSSQSSRRINVIATRKLPAWNGSAWGSAAATRSIAWAFANAAKANYGGRMTDAEIDLDGLLDLDLTWSLRGDTFDGVFDSQASVWEALTSIARAGRAQPILQGGILRCVRDGPLTVPSAMLSPRNIIKNSFSMRYQLPGPDTADGVEVSYFEANTWAHRSVLCTLPDETGQKPARVKLFGVTSREQAWREGMFMTACNRYRRRFPSVTQEMDGFILSPGDLVVVAHDVPSWGTSGEVRPKHHANELSWSEAFSTYWTPELAAVTVTGTPPTGFASCMKLSETTGTGYHRLLAYYATALTGHTYQFSVVAKAGERSIVALQIANGTGNTYAYFNLSTGAVGTTAAGTTASITALGSGWYWCSVVATVTGANASPSIYVFSVDGGGTSAGVANQGLYIAAAFAAERSSALPVTSYGKTMDLSRTMFLSEPVTFGSGEHYVAVRKRDGTVNGPHRVEVGAAADEVMLKDIGVSELSLDTGGDRERNAFTFGKLDTMWITGKVLIPRPTGNNQIEIPIVIESDAVHTADTGSAPTSSAWQLPAIPTAPEVLDLMARASASGVSNVVLSWAPAPGATHYLIEQGSDGTTWTRCGEVSTSTWTGPAAHGTDTLFRVAAVGAIRGPWVQVLYGTSAGYFYSASGDAMWTPTGDPFWS